LAIGLLIIVFTCVILVSGVPVAFGLILVAMLFTVIFEGPDSLNFFGELLFSSLADFNLVAIPMFVVMGAVVASTPAGSDLYTVMDRWLGRIPGGLAVSNIGACTLFAALSGSSPATCAAIGKMGIPEMHKRGYPDELATGAVAAGGTLGILIPPSITMIIYGVATGTSIGRLFLAGVIPGLLLMIMLSACAVFLARRHGLGAEQARRFSLREKLEIMPRVLPFLFIIIGILYVLYGGVATPSEASGVGAILCVMVAAFVYKLRQPGRFAEIFLTGTRESVMIMMIIGAAELFSYTLSSLYVTQSIAEWIAALSLNRWLLMGLINVFLLIAGCFLPPVAVILMTMPVLAPIVTQAGFDPYWFAVILTVNMEIGLITPPVGLNLYVIHGIVPQIPLIRIIRGTVPFILTMLVGIAVLCYFPAIATWLPDALLGPVK
jgi:tripartite ATP-independent transporter DctM subunit